MKLFKSIALLLAVLFTFGCASNETTSTVEEAPSIGDTSNTGKTDMEPRAKTAYNGSTGSGLLMERYKSGNIGGYRE